MAVNLRLEPRLQQRLSLTPELKTALELLQLPFIELEQRIEQELQENPLLEWDDSAPEPPSREMLRREGTDFAVDNDKPDFDPIERLVADSPGLHSTLEWQIGIAPWAEPDKVVAFELVPRIAPDGYLYDSDTELATELSIDVEQVAAARRLIQGLEPTGVGARDLAECLTLQLAERNQLDGLAARLLSDCLDCLESGDIDTITRRLGCSSDSITMAMDLLRQLDPQPGARFRDDTSDPIQPEINIERDSRGRWRVEPYKPWSHRLRHSPVMHRFQEDPQSFSKEERAFLREKIRSAEYFLNSLKQRELTLIRVTEAIIERQGHVIDRGPESAVPLTLKDIAEVVDLHESTVSRVTRRKYAITPAGIVELKSFFHQSVGGDHTANRVKQKIRELIDSENKAKPLSDQAISKALIAEGMDVARRTVAKYRTEMDIPTKSGRRQA